MALKDYLATDLAKTHFNMGEFAEMHLWNKREIVAVIDDDALMSEYSEEFQLLPKGSHRVLVPADQFIKKPKSGEVVNFDGAIYTIDEFVIQMEMYIIYLSRGDR